MMRQSGEVFDVLVVGGGSAGCAAAIGAARSGARTLLVERYGFLGGAATQSQVLSYCGFFKFGDQVEQTVAGVGDELLCELRRLRVPSQATKARSGNWIVMIDPEAVKVALDRLVWSAGVEVMLHTQLVDVVRQGEALTSVVLADHTGLQAVHAHCFVDASGEASLATFGGVPLTQDSTSGVSQPASLPVRLGGVPDEVKVDRNLLARLIAEHNVEGNHRILRDDGGVLTRLPVSNDFWWMTIDLNTDGLSGTGLAKAESLGREQAWQFLEVLRRHPGFERVWIASTGPQLGVRETRRPRSQCDVTEEDGLLGRRRQDGVARASWPMEVHVEPGKAKFEHIGGAGFFDVPLGSLKASGTSNLRLAGRVVGSDHAAYGSLRVMGTAFATGQAAGVSAALQAGGQADDASGVRKMLLSQNALV